MLSTLPMGMLSLAKLPTNKKVDTSINKQLIRTSAELKVNRTLRVSLLQPMTIDLRHQRFLFLAEQQDNPYVQNVQYQSVPQYGTSA